MSDNPVSTPTVVVTGLGAVSGYGWGVDEFWRGLMSGIPAIASFDRFDNRRHRTHVAAQVPERLQEARQHGRAGRRGDTSLADEFALAAAEEALGQAGLSPGDLQRRRTGVFFGSSTGGMFEAEAYYAALTAAPEMPSRLHQRPLVAHATSGPAEAVARHFGVAGPVCTISSACASATLALAAALEALRRGEIEIAIAGGADSLCRLTYAGFNALRAVDSRPCRPFRADRDGLSLGEGAGIMVLERAAEAGCRQAPALAILAGAGATCDAHHMTAPDPEGRGVARAISMAMLDAGLETVGVVPLAIGFLNAHGTGTPLNDAAEWAALRTVFGEDHRFPVTSTKGAVGHFLGSAGAIEAVATVRSLVERKVHPTPGEGPIDPQAPVDLVLGVAREIPADCTALSTNFAFGGSNAAAIFRSVSSAPSASPRPAAAPKPRDLVVSACGAVGPYGAGLEALGRALERGQVPRREVDRSQGFHRRGGSRFAALVEETTLAPMLSAAQARRMSQPSKFAVAAANLAMDQAGLAKADSRTNSAGVALATAYGPSAFTEKLLQAIFHQGPDQASPALFTESVASAAASQVALQLRLTGANLTITQRESGLLHAVAEAAASLRRGDCRWMLAGGVEEMTPLLHAVLDRFHALARPGSAGLELARPFDRGRRGFLAAEGAVVLVIEEREDAERRGVTPLCALLGAWSAFDATAPAWDWGHGADRLARELLAGLERAGCDPGQIELVVSGASGAVRGDRLEAEVLRRVFGERLPPVVAPKGALGEYGGGLLGAAVLAAQGHARWAHPWFEERDPELEISPSAELGSPRRVLVSSLGAGGSAAWLLLGRP
jgi:3-oxoacyl-[acyl-carrier-protein] synthase II